MGAQRTRVVDLVLRGPPEASCMMSLRSRRGLVLTSALLLLGACAEEPLPPAAAAPAPSAEPSSASAPTAVVAPSETFAADASCTTATGATFTAPSGWTLKSDGGQRVLDGPEPEIRLALVDLTADTPD